MSWRDQKRAARRTVHETFKVPCWRIPGGTGTPVVSSARIHVARTNSSNEGMGDIESQGYAQRLEIDPTLVFMRDEVQPARGDVFMFEPDEAYIVEAARPFDDITVTWKVARLTKAQLAKLPPTVFPIPAVI